MGPRRKEENSPEEFEIDPEEPVYVIGVVSRLVGLPVWTLRILDREGIVQPERSEGQTRLYSMLDVRRLVRVRHLIMQEGVNINGVRVILQQIETTLEEG